MSNLPSFRPRVAIGRVSGSQVLPEPQFIRYLEELARQSSGTTATVNEFKFSTASGASGSETQQFSTVQADTTQFSFEVV